MVTSNLCRRSSINLTEHYDASQRWSFQRLWKPLMVIPKFLTLFLAAFTMVWQDQNLKVFIAILTLYQAYASAMTRFLSSLQQEQAGFEAQPCDSSKWPNPNLEVGEAAVKTKHDVFPHKISATSDEEWQGYANPAVMKPQIPEENAPICAIQTRDDSPPQAEDQSQLLTLPRLRRRDQNRIYPRRQCSRLEDEPSAKPELTTAVDQLIPDQHEETNTMFLYRSSSPSAVQRPSELPDIPQEDVLLQPITAASYATPSREIPYKPTYSTCAGGEDSSRRSSWLRCSRKPTSPSHTSTVVAEIAGGVAHLGNMQAQITNTGESPDDDDDDAEEATDTGMDEAEAQRLVNELLGKYTTFFDGGG
ncbi:MAG: hypothetical protein Q9182_001707 [Xanthomendoza sp. 2 TL-2023]